jgi:hypothetical protein
MGRFLLRRSDGRFERLILGHSLWVETIPHSCYHIAIDRAGERERKRNRDQRAAQA